MKVSFINVFLSILTLNYTVSVIISQRVKQSLLGIFDVDYFYGIRAVVFGTFLALVAIYIFYLEMWEFKLKILILFNRNRKYIGIIVYWLLFILYPIYEYKILDLPGIFYKIILLGHFTFTIMFVYKFNDFLNKR